MLTFASNNQGKQIIGHLDIFILHAPVAHFLLAPSLVHESRKKRLASSLPNLAHLLQTDGPERVESSHLRQQGVRVNGALELVMNEQARLDTEVNALLELHHSLADPSIFLRQQRSFVNVPDSQTLELLVRSRRNVFGNLAWLVEHW